MNGSDNAIESELSATAAAAATAEVTAGVVEDEEDMAKQGKAVERSIVFRRAVTRRSTIPKVSLASLRCSSQIAPVQVHVPRVLSRLREEDAAGQALAVADDGPQNPNLKTGSGHHPVSKRSEAAARDPISSGARGGGEDAQRNEGTRDDRGHHGRKPDAPEQLLWNDGKENRTTQAAAAAAAAAAASVHVETSKLDLSASTIANPVVAKEQAPEASTENAQPPPSAESENSSEAFSGSTLPSDVLSSVEIPSSGAAVNAVPFLKGDQHRSSNAAVKPPPSPLPAPTPLSAPTPVPPPTADDDHQDDAVVASHPAVEAATSTPLASLLASRKALLTSPYTRMKGAAYHDAFENKTVNDKKKSGLAEAEPTADLQEMRVGMDGFVTAAVFSRSGTESGKKGRKANQDTFLMEFGPQSHQAMLGVFDGHGVNGRIVSAFVRDSLAQSRPGNVGAAGQPMVENLRRSFLFVDQVLKRTMPGVCELSGSTALICCLQGKKLMTAWAGDSRVVLAREAKSNGTLEPVQLSWDHKPGNPKERERILAHGGRVDRIVNDRTGARLGPLRVYQKYSWSPGLSTSRAFGDTLAHEVGVTVEPDINVVMLQPRDRFLILATDGVWEFMSNEEAVDLVKTANDVQHAAKLLVERSQRKWQEREGDVCDDTTALVVMFRHEVDPLKQ